MQELLEREEDARRAPRAQPLSHARGRAALRGGQPPQRDLRRSLRVCARAQQLHPQRCDVGRGRRLWRLRRSGDPVSCPPRLRGRKHRRRRAWRAAASACGAQHLLQLGKAGQAEQGQERVPLLLVQRDAVFTPRAPRACEPLPVWLTQPLVVLSGTSGLLHACADGATLSHTSTLQRESHPALRRSTDRHTRNPMHALVSQPTLGVGGRRKRRPAVRVSGSGRTAVAWAVWSTAPHACVISRSSAKGQWLSVRLSASRTLSKCVRTHGCGPERATALWCSSTPPCTVAVPSGGRLWRAHMHARHRIGHTCTFFQSAASMNTRSPQHTQHAAPHASDSGPMGAAHVHAHAACMAAKRPHARSHCGRLRRAACMRQMLATMCSAPADAGTRLPELVVSVAAAMPPVAAGAAARRGSRVSWMLCRSHSASPAGSACSPGRSTRGPHDGSTGFTAAPRLARCGRYQAQM